MTESAVAMTSCDSAEEAGRTIGAEILEKLGGKPPQVLLVFASSRYDDEKLLTALDDVCHAEHMLGSSSAGEFTGVIQQEGSVCAIGIRSDVLQFSSGLGQNLTDGQAEAAASIVSRFNGLKPHSFRHHTAIVMADALVGFTDDLIQALTVKTQGKYQIVGGGAGDDACFKQTQVFYGRKAYRNAAVALEILSDDVIGVGVKHGWDVGSESMRVTDTDGLRVISLNGAPAIEAFEDFAEATGQTLKHGEPIPFFLTNVLGIQTIGGYKLRVPLAIHEDGSITFASDIPKGSLVSFMRTGREATVKAATQAAEIAMSQLNGRAPKVALFFDCVATRLRLGAEFNTELSELSKSVNGADIIGCNTYGQIARLDGQFSGFHNCSAVTCLIP